MISPAASPRPGSSEVEREETWSGCSLFFRAKSVRLRAFLNRPCLSFLLLSSSVSELAGPEPQGAGRDPSVRSTRESAVLFPRPREAKLSEKLRPPLPTLRSICRSFPKLGTGELVGVLRHARAPLNAPLLEWGRPGTRRGGAASRLGEGPRERG